MSEAELREKYLELQMALEQVRQLQHQFDSLEGKRQELLGNIESVNDMKSREASEMLVPVVDGIFAKAKTENAKEVYVNVGAGVTVKKTIEQACEMLREKDAEIQRYGQEVFAELEKNSDKVKKLEESLEPLMAKNKNV